MSSKSDPSSPGPITRRLLVVGRGLDAHVAALVAEGYHVVGAADVQEALRHHPRPDALIVELRIPEQDLLHFKDWRTGPHTTALTVIGLAGEQTRDAVIKAGATFCRYPCPPEELVAIMKQILPLTPPAPPV